MMSMAALTQFRPAGASLRAWALLAVLVGALFAASGGVSPHLALDNLRQAAPIGVVALGQALILMMGRLDLSTGATASTANIVLSTTFAGDMRNVAPALAATFAVGAIIGLANGLMATKLKIPSFLATLATSLALTGAMLVYTGGSPKGATPAAFRVITEGWLGPAPISGLIWLAVVAIVFALVHLTVLGRKMQIVGANRVAAIHSGLPADGLTILAFVATALLATLGGVLLSAITGMAMIGAGDSYTLDSIAAAVIGGALFAGGVFLPAGAVAEALILFFLQSLLYLLSLPIAARFILQGGVIILALALANVRREKRS
jgi:ribose/xylose/arabinose/galactoside ABC-type transport system permease subunit